MKEPPQAQHQARILLADDDPDILEVVSVLLASEGYRVDAARDGLEALALARHPFDLAILDVMMPKASGLEVCERLRLSSNAPILFLTARSQDADKVAGLAAGGDDYLVKPFSTPELLARVKAMLRRYRQYGSAQGAQTGETIQAGPVLIDTRARRVSKGETPVALTDLEYEVLLALARNRGRVVSARELYENVWRSMYLPQSNNTVMAHIKNLRKKLEADPRDPQIVRTVWGRGYTID
ncbi:response regulator transcription factor [Slackia exigua]|uniref:Response regulator receiver domain protein n=1 Tax=Slackia exigua (strain ATCC 700122 / DSM 15923 / CIP 105133 / JCM 11022 / KCTC 5966 / S-7) TaxID=649764 RepID=D0WJJ7_SLAES|nr:response regulator transcription factor [Slackia exigua]EEZ60545.1 response regulator receiver domain protein [Slackia exigua ATCC 700122]STN99653.1 Transcriptional regulatory protein YycF [Slackia exigua]